MRRWVLRPVWILAAFILLFTVTGLVHHPAPGPFRLSRWTVDVDGTPLSFHQEGRGPDVLLVHGGMGSAEDFERILPVLASRYRVTAVDRPGFGQSGCGRDDHTLAGNARLLLGLTRSLGLVHPIVVGHSHGGAVALHAALDAPDAFRGLVLLSALAYPADGGLRVTDRLLALPAFGEGLAAWIGPVVGSRIVERTLVKTLGPDRSKVPSDFVATRVRWWTNPLSLATHARQQLADPSELALMAARYRDVRAPTTVVWCDGDPFQEAGGPLQSHRLAAELPHAREVALHGCGHYVQYGNPGAVVAAIDAAAGGG